VVPVPQARSACSLLAPGAAWPSADPIEHSERLSLGRFERTHTRWWWAMPSDSGNGGRARAREQSERSNAQYTYDVMIQWTLIACSRCARVLQEQLQCDARRCSARVQ
jgi:hypothetical protein